MKKWIASLLVVLGFSFGSASLNPTVPGALNPEVNQSNIYQTVCVPGYTATIRPSTSYTGKYKKSLLPAGTDLSQYELDHAISLVLGGNPADHDNLWAQKYPQARWKDMVEVYLKNQVCSGKMTLKEAQKKVMNWYPVYLTLSTKQTFGGVVVPSDLIDLDDD